MRLFAFVLFAFQAWGSSVREFKAKGDGLAKDTAAIQAAIDEAARQGGGVVFFPAGSYLSGSIHLKRQVSLDLAPGAVILASPDEKDFDPYEALDYDSHADKETTYFHYALIAADGASDISIVGRGVIDGNRTKRGGPKPISIKNSSHIAIRGITVRNAPNYSISFLGCDYVDVDGVTILNGYADGIDPDCSRFVRISNCFIESRDDAICPKTSLALGRRRPTEHVTVTNCILSSRTNNFKLGTESSGDFKDIALSNCVMFQMAGERRAHSGISIESVDGANIDGVVISNVAMRDVEAPIFIRLGNRGRGLNPATPGGLANVLDCQRGRHRIEQNQLDHRSRGASGAWDQSGEYPGLDRRAGAGGRRSQRGGGSGQISGVDHVRGAARLRLLRSARRGCGSAEHSNPARRRRRAACLSV